MDVQPDSQNCSNSYVLFLKSWRLLKSGKRTLLVEKVKVQTLHGLRQPSSVAFVVLSINPKHEATDELILRTVWAAKPQAGMDRMDGVFSAEAADKFLVVQVGQIPSTRHVRHVFRVVM